MPISYLEGNPQDVYAIQNLGRTFSDALIGMQANRQYQQRVAAQQAMDAAYFQLARQKAKEDALTGAATRGQIGAETGLAQARTGDLRMQTDELAKIMASAEALSRSVGLVGGGQYPQGGPMNQALQADIAKQAAYIAALQSPGNVVSQTAQAMQLPNPVMQRLMATREPMIQSIPGGGLFDVGANRLLYESPGMRMTPEQQYAIGMVRALSPMERDETRESFGEVTPEIGALRQRISQLGGVTNAPVMESTETSNAVPVLPRVGQVVKGYRYKGGDPSSKNSWEKVQ